MSKFSQKVTVANFTCRFGEKYVLLDFYLQLILPAFKSNTKRKYGNSTYFLNDVTEISFAKDELAIAGRIIKDTVLEREQVYVNDELVADQQSIQSSPSSFFLLK